MHRSDTNPYHEIEMSKDVESPANAIDFTVDSAGNVSPLTERKAESFAGRAPPPQGRRPRSG